MAQILKYQSQCVKMLCNVLSGVPQGSIRGATIIINGFPESIRSSIPFLFADDTN